jgi:hypothetical protein
VGGRGKLFEFWGEAGRGKIRPSASLRFIYFLFFMIIFSNYFSFTSHFFQNFLLLFLSSHHFFFQKLKNKIFKKNTIIIKN